jgi:hypothetical protein
MHVAFQCPILYYVIQPHWATFAMCIIILELAV